MRVTGRKGPFITLIVGERRNRKCWLARMALPSGRSSGRGIWDRSFIFTGLLYSQEYNYGLRFEGYVAQSLGEYALLEDFSGSSLWLAEEGGRLVGMIAIAKRSEAVAQLRWFLLHPQWRGKGLGKFLLQQALDFCRNWGYQRVFLWTTRDLEAACRLYERAGFRPGEEKQHDQWGVMVTEVRYDLEL